MSNLKLLQMLLGGFLFFVLCPYLGLPGILEAQTTLSNTHYWTIKQSDSSMIVLEFHFPWPDISEFQSKNKKYQQCTIKDLGTFTPVGAPEVPGLSIPFYAPADSNLEIQWQGQSSRFILDRPLLPRPTRVAVFSDDGYPAGIREEYREDPHLYDSLAWSPQRPIRVRDEGYFRQARICNLIIEPVQVQTGTSQVIFHDHLEVVITFKPGISKLSPERNDTCHIFEENRQLYPLYRMFGINSLELLSGRIALKKRQEKVSRTFPNSQGGIAESYRIVIHETGMHVITYEDLEYAGLPISDLNPQHLAMYKNGNEIAILVNGEDNAVFDQADTIIFYGLGVGNSFVNQNTYWLKDKGSAGKRMQTLEGALEGTYSDVISYQKKIHIEQNSQYWSSLPDGLGVDHWFWGLHFIAPEARQYSFEIISPVSSGQATFGLALFGKSYNYDYNPDHHVRFLINDDFVYEYSWDGQTPGWTEFEQALSALNTGENILTVELDGAAAPVDSIYMNYFQVTYPRLLEAENDCLSFNLEGIGLSRATIFSFQSHKIYVFDVTEHHHVGILENARVGHDSEQFKITFRQNLAETHFYEAITEPQLRRIDTIQRDLPSDLQSAAHGADLIIVAPAFYHLALAPLVKHRQNQGYRVFVADVQDVYDEFSDGLLSPDALIDFFQYAYDYWQPPQPLAILLIGEANVDFHDYYGTGITNVVPTNLINITSIGETVSDHPYTTLSGSDDLPDIFLGRVTANTLQEIEEFVAKLLTYETQTIQSDWNQKVLLVADKEKIFEDSLEALKLAYCYPYNLITDKVFLRKYDSNISQATQDIINSINEGRLFCFYLGHGSFENWSYTMMFDTDDVVKFNNGPHLPLLVASSCLNGYFGHHTVEHAMAEEWLRHQQKGAIVTASSTGLTALYDNHMFHFRLLQQFLEYQEIRAGIAIMSAEIMAYLYDDTFIDHVMTQSVLGCPLTVIRMPDTTQDP
ncbi:C25 family cysteine peptidase [candidate division CSSED10-310 bacterium]|uniref:C25 family cysteine peptidase n=1 Tax=candidate division CSSED10-310 bacterium TaxID=2855610 RepID=A0ABV6YTN1_UNCC1